MKAAFEEWQHWLEGSRFPFSVLTDHRNLEYLHSARRLNHRQARWALFFTQWGNSALVLHAKADALSPILVNTSASFTWSYLTYHSHCSSGAVGCHDWDHGDAGHRSHTYWMSTQQDICTSSLEDPSQQVHDLPSSGHPGLTVCIQLLSNKFWWSTLRTDIIVFIKNCVTCNTSKSSKQMPAGLLQPLPIPQRPWSHIAIDFITDLPNSKGNTTILTVIDRFSKSCHLIPLPKLPTALETAEVLCS